MAAVIKEFCRHVPGGRGVALTIRLDLGGCGVQCTPGD